MCPQARPSQAAPRTAAILRGPPAERSAACSASRKSFSLAGVAWPLAPAAGVFAAAAAAAAALASTALRAATLAGAVAGACFCSALALLAGCGVLAVAAAGCSAAGRLAPFACCCCFCGCACWCCFLGAGFSSSLSSSSSSSPLDSDSAAHTQACRRLHYEWCKVLVVAGSQHAAEHHGAGQQRQQLPPLTLLGAVLETCTGQARAGQGVRVSKQSMT